MLLFLASLSYVPAFFCFPSFVTRSNLSSFATGSSLRAESPLPVVLCILSHGFASCPLLLLYFLICSNFSPSFSSLCRFPSASAGLPWGFSSSPSCRLAFLSTLVLFLFLVSVALSSSGFSQILSSPVVVFSFYFHTVAVRL